MAKRIQTVTRGYITAAAALAIGVLAAFTADANTGRTADGSVPRTPAIIATPGERTIQTDPAYPLPQPAERKSRTEARRSGPIDGATLYYTGNCAGCHGTMANMKGTTAEMIRFAIDNNVGGMGFHVNLTPEELHSIADALK